MFVSFKTPSALIVAQWLSGTKLNYSVPTFVFGIIRSQQYFIQINLLSENKLIICAFENLHCQISTERFEPEPGLEPLAWHSTIELLVH